MDRLKEDAKPAGFTGASTAVMGTAGGLMPAMVHSILVGGSVLSFSWMLSTDVATVAAIGIGQGIAAAATALARGKGEFYISPRRGFMASMGVGLFNGLMYFVQMALPATELGWTIDLLILGAVGAAAGWLAVKVPSRDPLVLK
ncbi:MAG TPA: hypothetical protein VGI92_00215 [Gemmatimonadales bacterium]|jgi:hypothetical protein